MRSNQVLNLGVPQVFGLSNAQSTAEGEVGATKASLRLDRHDRGG